jgi:Fis family transcriptional regulator
MITTTGVKANGIGLKANGTGLKYNSHGKINSNGASRELPLRGHTERALREYFASLNGHWPARLYDMVMHEVEEPLFRAGLDYAAGNQSRAAVILGINRGTLRKKLRALGLSE